MLAKHSKNKLSAFKFESSSLKFSTASASASRFSEFQCGEEDPKIPASQCPEIHGFSQTGFSRITREVIGKALHAACLKSGTHLSIFHTNTLINLYSRFGNTAYAQQVFDEMPERNAASWNNMISGHVRAGQHVRAYELFLKMWARGFELNGYSIASLLTGFSRSGSMFYEGLQIHSLVLKNGLVRDVFVGTSLLHFYGGYGIVSNARLLFEEMPDKNVVSWTSLMVNYADIGLYNEVVSLYRRMRREGGSCNQNTFTTVISSCGALGDECFLHQVIGHVIKSGLMTDVSVSNSLISIFGVFSRLDIVEYVFDQMDERDTISWNSILAAFSQNGLSEESLRYFHLMRVNHGEMDESTLSTMLSACGSSDTSKWGRGIHGLILKLGFEFDTCLSNTLLSMYLDTGRHKDAEKLFDNMSHKDLISWNTLMSGYVSGGKFSDALRVFRQLLHTGSHIANFVTFASALSACANSDFLSGGMIVHALVLTSGLHENTIVGNALITMYGKCGNTREAKKVFRNLPEKELVTWNALVGGYAENEEVDDAIESFKSMIESGVLPNYISLINVIGCCDPRNLKKYGAPLHGRVLVSGFESDEYVRNSLISMYAKCGDLDSSNSIFAPLVNIASATWSSMVSANAQNGKWEESLKLLVEMQRSKVDFDQYSLSASLSASANLAIMEGGQHLHCLSIKLGLNNHHFVSSATMDMYGKCGELDDLLRLLPDPKRRSRLSWNILISAFARHGSFRKAQEVFQEMVEHNMKPDHVTFVSLLSACSHGGLVDEGLEYFRSMGSEFEVPVAIEHCVCMVDLLGRSGRLSEAEAFIKEMPVPASDFIWRTLLSACKTHGHLELGKKAARKLLEANPSDDSAYVLYSNVCAKSGRWEDVLGVRVKMGTENVRKKPAFSWLNVRNKISTFGAGDKSHEESERIYSKLIELRREIKEAGYVSNTSYEMHDTDEEQKEDSLWNHSERLALAYGLISTRECSTLRIFKNLRVCGDCHSVFKFVSGVVGREIVLRDPYRFHHFLGGKCSCNDYW